LTGESTKIWPNGIFIEIVTGGTLLLKNRFAIQDLIGISGNFESKFFFLRCAGGNQTSAKKRNKQGIFHRY
jgi:hypothetical protein